MDRELGGTEIRPTIRESRSHAIGLGTISRIGDTKPMTLSLQPYPSYKPSGLEWLGDVPKHWESIRISAVARGGPASFTDGDWVEIPHITDSGVRLIQTGNVGIGVYREKGFRYINEQSFSELRCTEVIPGDILICRLANPVGRACLAPDLGVRMITSVDVCILKPSELFSAKYLVFLLNSQFYLDYVASIVRGSTRDRISRSMLGAIKIALPPLPEQRAIVRYLDHVDDRIRRYVSSKEQLIALLEEERQAVIHRAVTRGLDHNVRLKPSGVEWLGDVPAHWEVRRLRTVASIGTGGRDTINRRDDGKYPFFVRSQTIERIDTWSFDGEAVLTAGDGVGVGKVFHYVNGKFDYHQRVYKFSNFSVVLGKFFFCYFESMLRYEVYQGTAKSTVDSLRLPMLQNFPVALPPVPEQTAIVEHLNKATADIDTAISRARCQTELLREYRTRLIADVVTGKLDVREAAAELPSRDSPYGQSSDSKGSPNEIVAA